MMASVPTPAAPIHEPAAVKSHLAPVFFWESQGEVVRSDAHCWAPLVTELPATTYATTPTASAPVPAVATMAPGARRADGRRGCPGVGAVRWRDRRGLRRGGRSRARRLGFHQRRIDRGDVALLDRHRRRRGSALRGRGLDPMNARIDRHGRSHRAGGEHDVVNLHGEVGRLRRHTDGQPRYPWPEVRQLLGHQSLHVLSAVGLRLALRRREVVERRREPSRCTSQRAMWYRIPEVSFTLPTRRSFSSASCQRPPSSSLTASENS